MTHSLTRRNADGSTAVTIREERWSASDQELFKPIVAKLLQAVDILGGQTDPLTALGGAIELVRHANIELRALEPQLETDARAEAVKLLTKVIRELRETEKLYLRGGA